MHLYGFSCYILHLWHCKKISLEELKEIVAADKKYHAITTNRLNGLELDNKCPISLESFKSGPYETVVLVDPESKCQITYDTESLAGGALSCNSPRIPFNVSYIGNHPSITISPLPTDEEFIMSTWLPPPFMALLLLLDVFESILSSSAWAAKLNMHVNVLIVQEALKQQKV